MEEDNNKFNFKKIISEAITGSIIVIICAIVLGAIFIVVSPNIQYKTKISKTEKNQVDNALSKIEEALVRVYDEYIDEVSFDTLVEGAISGIASSTGDPYTRYMSQEEFDELLVEGDQEYVGIGTHLIYDTDKQGILILGIMPDSPALEAGLKAGDVIYYVEGNRVTLENYKEQVDVIKGEENTSVKLIIARGDELKEFNVTRKKIKENNISYNVLDDNIGYIRIWGFENKTYEQFKDAYDKLRAQNISGLIIDLRNNPGGFVDQALYIANLLVPESNALKLVSRKGVEKVYKTTSNTQIDIPLAIVVNQNSASSSEILSSIIKDSKKGVIVGAKTYGKGIVQTTKKLSFGGALSITTAKYYTESGVEIHKNGIEPNIKVELDEKDKNEFSLPYEKDLQLQKAVEYVKGNI
ncbi:c-terminal processing peptidase [Clostridium sp. CAG:1219]|nr:c-terminal processing peptidase [Clostridium sp. CAG:1219]